MVDSEDFMGLPQYAGAINGCVIPLHQPTGLYKTSTGVTRAYMPLTWWQCVTQLIFTYVDVGQPDSVEDGASFVRSDLKKGSESGVLFPMSLSKTIQGPIVLSMCGLFWWQMQPLLLHNDESFYSCS